MSETCPHLLLLLFLPTLFRIPIPDFSRSLHKEKEEENFIFLLVFEKTVALFSPDLLFARFLQQVEIEKRKAFL